MQATDAFDDLDHFTVAEDPTEQASPLFVAAETEEFDEVSDLSDFGNPRLAELSNYAHEGDPAFELARFVESLHEDMSGYGDTDTAGDVLTGALLLLRDKDFQMEHHEDQKYFTYMRDLQQRVREIPSWILHQMCRIWDITPPYDFPDADSADVSDAYIDSESESLQTQRDAA